MKGYYFQSDYHQNDDAIDSLTIETKSLQSSLMWVCFNTDGDWVLLR